MAHGQGQPQEIGGIRDAMDDEIDLFDYLRIVWKYRWTISLLCAVAAVTTGVLCLMKPPRYVATASIVPPPQSSSSSSLGSGLLGGAESALLRNVMNVTSVADLYVGILESRAVANAIIDRFDLTHVYDVNGVRYEAERLLRKNTSVKLSDEGIISVTVEDGDPSRAAAIANAYVEELDLQNKRLSGGQATSKRIFLENRLAEIEKKLSRIETMPAHEAQVQEMLYTLLIRELEIAKIEEAKNIATIQVLDAASPPEVRKARGTVRKAMLAGVASLMFGVFLAFAREYVAQQRVSSYEGGSFKLPPTRPQRKPPAHNGNGESPQARSEPGPQVAREEVADPVETGERR